MRLTRAALRAQESEEALKAEIDIQLQKQDVHEPSDGILIHEDSDRENSELSIFGDNCPSSARIVLKDITIENYPEMEATDTSSANKGSENKDIGKAKKRMKRQKKNQALDAEEKSEGRSEADAELVVEQVIQSTDESPLFVRNEDITTGGGPEETLIAASDPTDIIGAEVQDNGSAIEAADYETQDLILETMTKTPRFDPELHNSSELHHVLSGEGPEDSFVGTIKSRSPRKHEMQQSEATTSLTADSTMHTPAKSISSPRVEDSVAALDALEEAIEKFAEVLPALDTIEIESPTKFRRTSLKTPAKAQLKSPLKSTTKAISPVKAKIAGTQNKHFAQKLADARRTTVRDRVQAIESKPNISAHRRTTSVVVTKPSATTIRPMVKPGHTTSKSVSSTASKPMVSFSNSPVKDQPIFMRKRVTSGSLSTSKPGFVPSKSVKPPTKADFILPGEAIAAKLKAKREERLKREEVAAGKNQVKTKPPPTKSSRPSVVPRATKTSLARLSIMQKSGGENKENVTPPKPTATKLKIGTATKRDDTTKAIVVTQTTLAGVASKNIVRKSTSVSSRVVSTNSATSTISQPSITIKPVVRGKEVFNRSRKAATDHQHEKKDKEEAAKKARAEAAEKGRQASREWAERQKRKTMALSNAKAKVPQDTVATS